MTGIQVQTKILLDSLKKSFKIKTMEMKEKKHTLLKKGKQINVKLK